MLRSIFIIFFSLSISWVVAQSQYTSEYLVRDSLIDNAMNAENYEFAAGLMEQQFELINNYGIFDSLYRYCYNYGRAKWKIQNPEKGIEAATELSQKVKEKDEDIIHYLQTLNDLSWLYYETGNISQCRVIDSTYLAICLKNKNVPTAKITIAYYNLGFDYMETGNYNLALQQFQSSADVILNSNDSLPKALSMSYNALGAVQWHLGLLEEAKKNYQASLDLIENETDPKSQLEKGNIIGNIALILQDNGEIIKAKEYQERFIRINTQALLQIDDVYLKETALRRMSSAYLNLADIYFSLGDYSKSRKLLELVIEERQKILEPDDPSLTSAIEHLAYHEMQSGNYPEAENKFLEYIIYCKQYFGEKSAKTAGAYKDLGLLYLKKGEYAKSEEYFEKAIQSQVLVGNPDIDPYLAIIYRERATLFVETKEPGKALDDLKKSKQIFSRSREIDNPVMVDIYLEMAEIKIETGDYINAKADIDQSLELMKGKDTRVMQTPPHFPKIFYLKALARVKTDSSEKSLILAMSDLEIAIDFLKNNKLYFQDEESKLMLYDAHKWIFELAENISYSLFEKTQNKQWLETFFHLTEENRTILLRSRLQNFSSLDYAGVPDSILIKERKLSSQLRNESEDLQQMKNIVDLERQYTELVNEIKENYPEYYDIKFFDKTNSFQEIREKLLNKNKTLLIYSLTEDNIYTLLIDYEDVRIFKNPKNNLSSKIRDLNDALIKNDEIAFTSLQGLLYQSLFADVRPFLKNNELLIVPDKELFFLNFEILSGEQNEKEWINEKMLIYNYTISYYLSTTVAMQFEKLNNEAPNRLLTFAPGFSDRQKSDYKTSVSDSARLDKRYLSYIQQPFAVRTAKQIAGYFSGTAIVEEQADETTFKEEAGKYGIIHLGTHADIDQNAPLMSHLVLSKNIKNDSLDDGYLHAYEIYQMPLRAELAVLTACETGVGKQQNSEGIISLAHSFSYAGCPSIVMSLWNIDEKTSSVIINDFYHYIAKGKSKSQSLRQAKLDYLASAPQELQSPYYWAGMVLLGDTSPIVIDTGFNWLAFSVVAILALLLLFIFIKRKKAKASLS